MKIIIKKWEDVTGYYWLILDKNSGNELYSYCREIAQTEGDEKSGGYTWKEISEKVREHKEWEL